jgi:beta-glucosidase
VTIERSLSTETWRDPAAPAADRVRDLLARMTVREKIAQLSSLWVNIGASSGAVAPHQDESVASAAPWETLISDGVGQLTRPYGTAPVGPADGAQSLAGRQRQIIEASRLGIPAMVHEECLTGLGAWQATVFPSPLCWGASFDPGLVEQMSAHIGRTMRRLGVHQGLAPVLDVLRDLRWGRTEETIGEDPYLVGLIGSGYVRGLESAGIVATLKHFAGYSASRGARNLAPVSIGPRELADVLLPPFEMALRAGARSVMNSYTDLDGVPVAADATLLTGLLRDGYGFTGTVVSDYFSVAFLHTLHGVAGTRTSAAQLALQAGIDVELPMVDCYGEPLVTGIESGVIDMALLDRAVARVLSQKCELGLLDPGWTAEPGPDGTEVDLDDPQSRALAGELARRSIVLLRNEGVLPLAPGQHVAVVGPRADDPGAMLGCYSFPRHVGVHYPDVALGIEIPTVLGALRADPAGYTISYAPGCPVLGGTDAGIAAAARTAADADVCVAVLGDQAGLFGMGTSGEGCDRPDLRLPGRQSELLDALLGTGTPVVLILLVGRPYELSEQVDRLDAALCGFFPGEEGGTALADILSGRVNPSGHLPVSFPSAGATQPSTYLAPQLGQRNDVSTIDPTPVFPFGHGLSYAPASWGDVTLTSPAEWPTDGSCQLAVTLGNDTSRPTTEVVQVYLHDPVAEVARPTQQLIAAARVDLTPGQTRTAQITLHADLTSYTGRSGRRQVDPGPVELQVGASSADVRATLRCTLTGPHRHLGPHRILEPEIKMT